jgi:hypothetical protein
MAIFVGSTFAFTVLFEHGPADFVNNAKKEGQTLKVMLSGKPAPKKDENGKSASPAR